MIATFRFWTLASFLVWLPVAALVAADLAEIVEQLDSADFIEREEASRQLGALGAEAVPLLERTVATGSREASTRAMQLLKQQLEHGETAAKQAANEALSRLAESQHATTAQRARDVLKPPVERTALTPWGGMPNPQQRFNNLQLQVGANPGGILGGVRRVSYSEINGRRVVEIAERDRVVKMETLPGGSVEVSVSEKQNGKDVTRTISAKDREELVRKDPETAKLYDEYHRRGAGPFGLGGGFPPPGIGPQMPVQRGPLSPQEMAKRQVAEIEGLIQRHKAQLPGDAAKRTIDLLERSKQRYQELLPLEHPQEARRPTLR